MKTHDIVKRTALMAISAALVFTISASAAETDEAPKAMNTECPVDHNAVVAGHTAEIDGKTYAFCSDHCCEKFQKDVAESLYGRLGGKAAIDAAVELFYKKVLADDEVSDFFEDIHMGAQRRKQKEFVSAVLGGPEPWVGKDMRAAHSDLDIRESDFNAIAGHFKATLEELKIEKGLVDEVMAVIASTKEDVLGVEATTPE